MKKEISMIGLIIFFSFIFMNCGTEAATEETKDSIGTVELIETPENNAEVINTETSDEPINETGKLCFELENKKFSNTVEIFFSDNNKVKGNFYVYIHDEDMGYETSSDSEFEGEISGDQIKVELIIEIEGNIEHESEIWEYKDGFLMIDGNEYIKVECKTTDE